MSVSAPSRFRIRDISPSTPRLEDCLGHRNGLGALEKIKTFDLVRNRATISLLSSPYHPHATFYKDPSKWLSPLITSIQFLRFFYLLLA